MTVIYAVILFGVIVIGGLIVFGMFKLQRLCKQILCICDPEQAEGNLISCKKFKKIHSDFLLRRNEFWSIFVQYVIIIFIITVLTVLLIMDKVSSEAAIPVMAGLASFAVGKAITNAKTNGAKPDKPPTTESPNA